MLKIRRTGLALAFVAILALALSACGSSQTNHSSAPANATDTALVNEMIPHHESAIEMAKIAQERGQHAEVKILAGNIISSQEDEIAEMQIVEGQLSEDSGGQSTGGGMHVGADPVRGHSMASDAATLGMDPAEMGMSMDVSSLKTADPFDQAFLQMMLPHHKGAVMMAKAELQNGESPELRDLAQRIISAQMKEIGEMQAWLAKWYPDAGSKGMAPMQG